MRITRIGVSNRHRCKRRFRRVVVDRLPRSSTADHRGREQAVERAVIDCRRFDFAGLSFEHPVTTLCRRPRRIDGCSNVGTGRLRQRGKKGCAVTAESNITTVEHHIRMRGKTTGQFRQPCRLTGQRGEIDHSAADDQLALGTVRNDVHRIDLTGGADRVGDLAQGIARRIEQHNIDAGTNRRDDVLPAGNRSIDKRNLAPRRHLIDWRLGVGSG